MESEPNIVQVHVVMASSTQARSGVTFLERVVVMITVVFGLDARD